MSANRECGCGCGGVSCGCCAGVEPVTPERIANRPGIAALSYRVGTYGSFFETMSAQLGLQEFPAGLGYDGTPRQPSRPLAALRMRAASDPAMALVDAWSCVGDVLTFYQERIANEGYLRTATETRSVYELARLIGYRPRPGVAASVYLAYGIDANTPEEVVIPKGARSQSVPGPGEFPQSFETSAALAARARWNDLKLRLEQPQRFATIVSKWRILFKGVNTGLVAGDPLLILDGKKRSVVRVVKTLPDNEKQRTEVRIQPWPAGIAGDAIPAPPSLAPLEQILARAPPGNNSTAIVDLVRNSMAHAHEATSGDALPRRLVDAAEAAITERLAALASPAPHLRSWAGEVREALRMTLGAVAEAVKPTHEQSISVASIVRRLSRPASQARANAAELPRSLAADFAPTSDAGMKLLGAVMPGIRDALGPSISGQTDPQFSQSLEVYAFRVRAGIFGRNAPRKQQVWRGDPVRTEIIGEWPIVEISKRIGHHAIEGAGDHIVTAIHESPGMLFLDAQHEGIVPRSWVLIDSSAVVTDEGQPEPRPLVTPAAPVTLTRVREVHARIGRACYGISADTVRLDVDDAWISVAAKLGDDTVEEELQPDIDRDFRVIRNTSVYARPELLELALEPIETDFCDAADEQAPAELDGLYPDLEPGRFVIVTGERADLGDGSVVSAAEALMVRAVRHDVRVANGFVPWTDEVTRRGGQDAPEKLAGDRPHTFLWFDKPLSYCYRRDTVAIRANVVKATHGETRSESLGNGDGSKPWQSFALKQFPLTHLAAPSATGAASTLEVYVNDVRWQERESFIMAAPTDRIYVTRADELGKTSLVCGNGVEGARLPTGVENIKAVYRNGIGKPGNVRAGQISQLSTRPLGVRDVVNPLRASGGADLESRDSARRNAPNAVMALDRLVSTRDYADFARAFAGIGKAAALELSDGEGSIVHVTIAGQDDTPIDPGSDLYLGLRRALRRLGDPFQPVQIAMRELLVLVIGVRVRIDADRRWEVVSAALRAQLTAMFGFERRELAQGVASSELLAAMQAVPGVAWVDLESFGAVAARLADAQAGGGMRARTPAELADAVAEIVTAASPPAYVAAAVARPAAGGAGILPAQLAILLPDAPDTLVINRIE